jgi:uncharacterized membrane protein (UPF0127 family)
MLCKLGFFLFSLEVCKDHSRGLMGRDNIPPKGGMVFLYDEPSHRDFHMKNCLTDLDIIFGKNGKIQKIHRQCPPCQSEECDLYSHPDSDCVIELKGGTCDQYGLKEGLIYRFF